MRTPNAWLSRTALLLLAGLTVLPAVPGVFAAQTALSAANNTEIEVGATHEDLTGGRADWRSVYVDFAHHFGERKTVYATLREANRFGMRDDQSVLGLYYPASGNVTGVVEGSWSSSHHFLPRWWLFGQIEMNLGEGWGIHVGARHAEFDSAQVNLASVTLERYFGAFRAAYTLYESWLTGSGAAPAHRVLLTYYYGPSSQFGVSYAKGREVENTGPPQGVVTSDVTSWVFLGRHWLNRHWVLSYEALEHRQGNLYTRRGARLGLRHHF